MRTILSHLSVPHSFWHHALEHATYLLNILPTKVLNNSTPTLQLYNRTPTYDHLRVFGCLCYPLLPSSTIHKLADRSTPCVFLGYPSSHRGYKCYNLNTNQVVLSRDVIFDETVFPFAIPTPNPSTYDFLHPQNHIHSKPPLFLRIYLLHLAHHLPHLSTPNQHPKPTQLRPPCMKPCKFHYPHLPNLYPINIPILPYPTNKQPILTPLFRHPLLLYPPT